MKSLSQKQTGEILIFFEQILWSLFPVVSILSLAALSPLLVAGWSTLFAAGFFAIILSIRRKWHEWRIRAAWGNILWGSILIGIIFYSLFFWGLKYTTAGNAAIFALLEVLFSFLFFGVWRKEKQDIMHVVGAVLIVFGAIIVLFPGKFVVNRGDVLIILAAFIAPFGNFFQQKARKQVSSVFLLLVRSVLSGIFLLALARLLGEELLLQSFQESFFFLFINGVFILGLSKTLWVEALHRISVPKAISLGSSAPFFTLLFAYFMLGEIPSLSQLFGLVPIICGVFFLTRK